jgi:hypothetical protein
MPDDILGRVMSFMDMEALETLAEMRREGTVEGTDVVAQAAAEAMRVAEREGSRLIKMRPQDWEGSVIEIGEGIRTDMGGCLIPIRCWYSVTDESYQEIRRMLQRVHPYMAILGEDGQEIDRRYGHDPRVPGGITRILQYLECERAAVLAGDVVRVRASMYVKTSRGVVCVFEKTVSVSTDELRQRCRCSGGGEYRTVTPETRARMRDYGRGMIELNP